MNVLDGKNTSTHIVKKDRHGISLGQAVAKASVCQCRAHNSVNCIYEYHILALTFANDFNRCTVRAVMHV